VGEAAIFALYKVATLNRYERYHSLPKLTDPEADRQLLVLGSDGLETPKVGHS